MKPEAFVARFLLPLVRGGAVHVGAPLGAGALDAIFDGNLDSGLEERVGEARHRVAAELLLWPPPAGTGPLALDLDAICLAIAVHDLLYLFRDRETAVTREGDRRRRVAAGAARLAALPPTTDVERLVARHTMLHLFPGLTRGDAKVSFWAGRREYRGQEPPTRLTAWPSLRRVSVERWRVGCFAEAAGDEIAAPIVRALLSASPLTDLFHPLRGEPPLDLAGAVPALGVPEVARLVTYRWLAEGLERVGGTIATSVLVLLRPGQPALARFLLQLVAHLHLCHLLGGDGDDGERRASPLLGQGDPAQRDFLGLFAALLRAAPELALPPDLRTRAADARLRRRIEAHAAACAEACPRTADLQTAIVRALGTVDLAASAT